LSVAFPFNFALEQITGKAKEALVTAGNVTLLDATYFETNVTNRSRREDQIRRPTATAFALVVTLNIQL
jgi:hypothetical protein